jgi:ABC-2 type transport system ATP-binding protein
MFGISMSAIEIENLQKRYGGWLSRRKVVALDGLTLSVPQKLVFGFLGPNGAGKTTTIKILIGLVLADNGSAQIFGEPVGKESVRERIGYFPESPRFYPHLTGEGFLHFCAKLMHLDRLERSRRSDELLARVGLTDAAGQKLEGYSRGMLQRLGIAQALMSNPDLLILDEPITGLDPKGRREVKQILADLKDEGKTIFFSSHILSDVEKMCDMVGIINHGRLVEKGEVRDLLGETGLEIWASNVPTDVLAKAESICSSVTMKDGRFGFILDDPGRREEVTRLVEDSGGTIQETISRTEELEEFFLRRVREDDEARQAGTEGKADE